MSDPRIVGLQAREANHSPLMKQLARAGKGEVVNACPFGCETGELDAQGYCHHLAGFTVPGNDGMFEPMVPRRDAQGKVTGRFVDGTKPEAVLPGDKLARITICSRVYREKRLIEAKAG